MLVRLIRAMPVLTVYAAGIAAVTLVGRNWRWCGGLKLEACGHRVLWMLSGNGCPWIVFCLLKYTKTHEESGYLRGSSTRMAGGDGVLLMADDGRVGRRVVGACPGEGGVGD